MTRVPAMAQYKYTAAAATHLSKHGIDLTVYGQGESSATVAHVSVAEGHFQEFVNLESSYTYYIITGRGTFYLNDEAVAAAATDLIIVPPKTRVYYFGAMEMLLMVSPAFDEKNERHIRFLEKRENTHTA